MDKKYNSYVIVGLQFGYEGKQKIIDYFAHDTAYIVRATGGNNAFNKVNLGGVREVLDNIPPSIVKHNAKCILGPHSFVDVEELIREMYKLEKKGISLDNFYIDYRANAIMPYHKIEGLDFNTDISKNGISNAYSDKVIKNGLRFIDFLDQDYLTEKLTSILKNKNNLLNKYNKDSMDINQLIENYVEYSKLLKKHIVDSVFEINLAASKKEKIILTSSLSTMLDMDYGTYKNVSSTSTTAAGILNGSGLAPNRLGEVVGVFKAYSTRVSEGLFPTEVFEDELEHFVKNGAELNVSTNVERRCGWLDLTMLKYAIMLNGVDKLCITKLDVLSGLSKIKVAVAYEMEQLVYQDFPSIINNGKEYNVLYKEFEGWEEDISNITEYDKLPKNCRKYIEYIEGYLGIKISIISNGVNENNIIIK